MMIYLCLYQWSYLQDGSTALMWVCKEGVLDIAQYLIFRKADVYAKDNVSYDVCFKYIYVLNGNLLHYF